MVVTVRFADGGGEADGRDVGGEIDGDKEPPKSDCTPSDELWRQLCAFVGKPLPREPGGELPPFPHLEYAADMRSDAPT